MGRPRLYQQKGAISKEKSKIITDIAKERIVEEITEHIAGRIGENERDLIQDIYVYLLDLPDPKLKGMQERGGNEVVHHEDDTEPIQLQHLRFL